MVARFLLVLVLSATLLTACAGEETPPPEAVPAPTPIARLNTAQMQLPRIDFCSLVDEVAIRAALGAKSWDAREWHNGDRAPVSTGSTGSTGSGDTTDVISEFLCEWRTRAGAESEAVARAWVFARPVTRAFARRTVRAARDQADCRTPAAAAFGRPSVLQVCTTEAGPRVRHAGLFADTWFTCELTSAGPVRDVRQRADQWCSRLVSQLNTTQ